MLALALLLVVGPACCARLPGDLQTQLMLSSGLNGLLSDRSSLADPLVADLGLPAAAQDQQQGPLANPAVHTVFSADSAIGRRAARTSLQRPEKSAGFDPLKAAKLAQLQSISYCAALDDVANWNCTRCAQLPDFEPYLVHFDASWDLLGYIGYWPSMGAKVIVFRGTDSSSWYNWAENMRAWRTGGQRVVCMAGKAAAAAAAWS